MFTKYPVILGISNHPRVREIISITSRWLTRPRKRQQSRRITLFPDFPFHYLCLSDTHVPLRLTATSKNQKTGKTHKRNIKEKTKISSAIRYYFKPRKMLQEVVRTNRFAIKCVELGLYEDAIKGFAKAMNLVQQNCIRDFEHDVQIVREKAVLKQTPVITEVTASMTKLRVEIPDTNDSLFEMYTRPFLLDDSVVVPPSVLFTTLAFNIGLVYHKLGLSKNSIQNLKYAVRYYEHGLALIKKNACDGYSSSGMYWLTLALLTNAGNILWALWCTDEAMQCRKRVKILLKGGQISLLPTEDLEFFFDVSSNGIFCSRDSAPAA